MKKISFIHAADLHLDSPFVGLKTLPSTIYERVQESTFQAFNRIIDEAINRKVDFLILAGDLYDGENRSIRAQIRLRDGFRRLNDVDIPVYIIHGNHDHLSGSWTNIKFPENVHVFPSYVDVKKYRKNDVSVHLYGFSYPYKHVHESMIEQYKKINGADFHIGILHGQDQANNEHYNYAPFTLDQLLKKEFDYWALGHIHKRQILCQQPYIIYPGNIQGRNKKELGNKGAYFVELSEFGTTVQFFETAYCIWEQEVIDCQDYKTIDSLIDFCLQRKEHWRKNTNTFLQIEFTNYDYEESKEELLSILQDQEEFQTPFVWVHEIQINNQNHFSMFQGDFFHQLEQEIQQPISLDEVLSPLYSHVHARKFLEELTEKEKEELIEQSKNLLYDYFK